MKKLLSLTLAVVMVLGMTTVAFAAPKLSQKEKDWEFEVGSTSYGFDDVIELGDLNPNAYDDATQGIYLNAEAAPGSGDGTGTANPVVKSDKVTISVSKKSGSAGIKDVELKYDSAKNGAAYIRVTGAKYWVSTKADMDFELNISFKVDGKAVKNGSKTSKLEVTGTFKNGGEEVVDADTEDVEIDKESNFRFKADEYNKGLEFIINDDVSLISRVFAGKKYYVNYDENPDDAAVAVLDQYKDIANYIEFKTVGMSTAEVQFNYADNMYAYTVDADGNVVYVGRTNDLLPYYNRYFVSNKELALPVAEEPVEEPVEEPTPVEPEVPADTDNDQGGGDDVAEAPSEANNYNPGTGR